MKISLKISLIKLDSLEEKKRNTSAINNLHRRSSRSSFPRLDLIISSKSPRSISRCQGVSTGKNTSNNKDTEKSKTKDRSLWIISMT